MTKQGQRLGVLCQNFSSATRNSFAALICINARTSEMITDPEWIPAGVCILGWSRSRNQYFRFEPEKEPESTLRFVQELNKIFKGPNFCNYACCCQTEWN